MKTYHWILIILVSLTGILTTLDFFREENNSKSVEDPPVEIYYFNELFKSVITNESIEVNDPIIYLGNDTANKMNFFDLVRGKCLVFRFSGEACNVCIEFVINKLKETFPDYSKNERILLVGSNINDRVKENYYGKSIVSFVSGSLGLPFEEYNTPFIMMLDRDRITKMFFVPEKALPELTDIYMKNIKARYFTNL